MAFDIFGKKETFPARGLEKELGAATATTVEFPKGEAIVYQDRKTDPDYMISYDASGEWLIYRVKLPVSKLKAVGV